MSILKKRFKFLGNLANIFGAALVIASLLVNAVPPRSASAHHPELSGQVICQVDGTRLITWTIANWTGSPKPMKITSISVSSGSVDVAINTVVAIGGSVTGHTSLPGTQTGNVTLTVTGFWDYPGTRDDVSDTKSATVNLGGSCTPPPPVDVCNNIDGNQAVIPVGYQSNGTGGCVVIPPDYQLNLSHIECVDGHVEIHFVLLNVPDGVTPGTLTYTYGSITPGAHTGNVWHYTDTKSDGLYNIQTASVVVNGVTVSLHNPGDYAGTYNCAPPPTDVCNNIEGTQATMPVGYQSNGTGGCVVIPPTDVCNNIDGIQASMPIGYQSNGTGGCVVIPPVDVCPNIEGNQATLPVGMMFDNNGNCVPVPPPDVCPNIDGIQASIPDGMISNTDGNCVPVPVPGCMDPQALNFNPLAIMNDNSCVYPPVPTASISCYSLELSAFRVSVGNTGPSGEIGYSTNLDSTIVSLGVIANGGTTQIVVPANATTLYIYPVAASGWGTPVEVGLSTDGVKVCEEDPMGLASFCSYVDLSLPHGWTVTNLNAFPVNFTWVYGSESSSAPIALTAGQQFSFTTGDHAGQLMQIFVDGILLASSEPNICPEFVSLLVSGICSTDPTVSNAWTASNSNAFDVDAEWRVNGSALTGLLTVPANSSVQFTTPISEGSIAEIYYGGVKQDDASAAQNCVTSEIPPELPRSPQTPQVQIQIPVTSSQTAVLIPVTGVADDLAGMLPAGLSSLGFVFFGLGLILHGIARRRIVQG